MKTPTKNTCHPVEADELFDGIIEGGNLPAHLIRTGLRDLSHIEIVSEFDRQIVRLLTLHPQLETRQAIEDLSNLSEAAKEIMLAELREQLGISPLRN